MTIVLSFILGFVSCAVLEFRYVRYCIRQTNSALDRCWYLERDNKQLQGLCLRWEEKRERQR